MLTKFLGQIRISVVVNRLRKTDYRCAGNADFFGKLLCVEKNRLLIVVEDGVSNNFLLFRKVGVNHPDSLEKAYVLHGTTSHKTENFRFRRSSILIVCAINDE